MLIVSGCGNASLAQPPGKAVAYLQTASGIQVIDAADGLLIHSLPAGTPASDWRHLYSVAAGTLQLVNTSSGALEQSLPVPSWASAAALSPDGHWLVVAPARGNQFEVYDSQLRQNPRLVRLQGNFSFDGISNDGNRLFLIEWLNGAQYQVRRYDLDTGRLYPDAIVDKSEVGQAMAGVRVSGLATPDGRWQFSLYTGAPKGAFVHALPLFDQPWASCIDLPETAAEAGWSIAMSPDGRAAYSANGQTGMVVAIPLADFPTSHGNGGFEAGAVGTAPAASEVSRDGRTLFVVGRSGLVAIDTRTLRQRGRTLDGTSLRGVRISGAWVYALSAAGHLLRIDPTTLRVVSDVPTRVADGLLLSVQPR